MSAPLTPATRRALHRIPVILAEHGWTTDDDLRGELRIGHRDLRAAIAILYKQRRVDRIGHYLVDRIGHYLVAPSSAGEPGSPPETHERTA